MNTSFGQQVANAATPDNDDNNACVYARAVVQIRFLSSFHLKEDHLQHLRHMMPHCEDSFFEWLATIDCSRVKVYALSGTPRP